MFFEPILTSPNSLINKWVNKIFWRMFTLHLHVSHGLNFLKDMSGALRMNVIRKIIIEIFYKTKNYLAAWIITNSSVKPVQSFSMRFLIAGHSCVQAIGIIKCSCH